MNDSMEKNMRQARERAHDKGRPRLREVVAAIDRDILRLLLKRHNLLRRMAHGAGHIDAVEEKFLRQAWESEVARVSRDARLSRQFFTLMQEAGFLPRPETGDDGQPTTPRPAFNLAPPKRPVKIILDAPLDSHATTSWLMLAAASGQPIELGPCLMNDAEVDCIRALDQLGAALNRDEGSRIAGRRHTPAGSPDKVLHMGASAWNFYLVLAHYLGRPSRAKFTGDAELKLASFGAVRNLLPQFGARLAPVVPGSAGLPVRVECSGALPVRATIPHDAPIELAEAIALAAPFYGQPLALGLAGHPDLGLLEERTLPILGQCGAAFSLGNGELRLEPTRISIPQRPALPMEPALCAFLLAFPLALGGECSLKGSWPDWTPVPWRLLQEAGLAAGSHGGTITARSEKPLASACLDKIEPELAEKAGQECPELALALAAIAAGNGGKASLPVSWREILAQDKLTEAQDFLHACGLVWDESGAIARSGASGGRAWTAPSPAYALAYALAACARPAQGFGLVNPGIITELYPAFWAIYNSLPEPAQKKAAPAGEESAPRRRRVRTQANAALPDARDDEEQAGQD